MSVPRASAEFLEWIEELRPAYYHYIAVNLATHTFAVELIGSDGVTSDYVWTGGKPEPYGNDRAAAINGFRKAVGQA